MTAGAPVAALPMYDFPEISEANDTLWRRIAAALAAKGVEAPGALERGRALSALWRDPSLILAQTCGYPYMTRLSDAVALVAAPEYAFPGCEGVDHRSFVVRAAQDRRRNLAEFRFAVAAVNSFDSNTGMNHFRATIAPLAGGRRFFSEVLITGSQMASLVAVGDGRAGLAAIDCVTFGLLRRFRPDLVARVAVAAETPSSPGLPFIMSARLPQATLAAVREALAEALADPALADQRATLGLKGARALAAADYERVLDHEREAEAAGYPKLA